MDSFVRHLSGTSQMWQRAIAPHAEWIARTLWKRRTQSSKSRPLATPLTQARRKIAQGGDPNQRIVSGPKPVPVCLTCGGVVKRDANYCARCAKEVSRTNLLQAAKVGRIAAQSPEAAIHRALTQKRQHASRRKWNPLEIPLWFDEKYYREKLQPRLVSLSVRSLATLLEVSKPYATDIRKGKRIPHPRHWQTLASLLGICAMPENRFLRVPIRTV